MMVVLAWFLACGPIGQDHELRLPDLPGYREALEPPADTSEPAVPVGFRELWERADRHRGRRVQVEGRVVRQFHQPPLGTFPALTELWIFSPTQDPFCVVFPTTDEAEDHVETGEMARFEGTFLKLIRYRAADDDRLAPLIVGPRPPLRYAGDPVAGLLPRTSFSVLDWVVGLAVALVVVALVLGLLVRRPVARPRPASAEPPPAFIDREED